MSYTQKRGFVSDFTVIDFETTGLYPQNHEIIELGAVRYRQGIPTDTFEALIKPKRPIPPDATRINQITNAMVVNQPSIDFVLHDFLDFIGDDVIVAHNAPFDLSFLLMAINRHNDTHSNQMPTVFRNSVADTLTLSKYYVKGLRSYKLQSLADYFAVDSFEAHRSIGDCMATGAIYLKLKAIAESTN